MWSMGINFVQNYILTECVWRIIARWIVTQKSDIKLASSNMSRFAIMEPGWSTSQHLLPHQSISQHILPYHPTSINCTHCACHARDTTPQLDQFVTLGVQVSRLCVCLSNDWTNRPPPVGNHLLWLIITKFSVTTKALKIPMLVTLTNL